MSSSPTLGNRRAEQCPTFALPCLWLKNAWAHLAFTSPESALQTLLWALREACQRTQKQALFKPEDESEAAGESWQASHAAMIAQCEWVYVMARIDKTSDEAALSAWLGRGHDDGLGIVTYRMKRNGGEWKCACIEIC